MVTDLEGWNFWELIIREYDFSSIVIEIIEANNNADVSDLLVCPFT